MEYYCKANCFRRYRSILRRFDLLALNRSGELLGWYRFAYSKALGKYQAIKQQIFQESCLMTLYQLILDYHIT